MSSKGYKHPEETRERMRKSHVGKKRAPMTDEHRKNIGLAGKGRIPWNKGKGLYLTPTMKKEILVGRKRPDNCEICGIPAKELAKGLCYDHDHTTDEFRGWICLYCNTTLGLVNDSVETLKKLISYLETHAQVQARKQ